MKDKLCDRDRAGERKEKQDSGCNEAYGGERIMRGGESKSKVRRNRESVSETERGGGGVFCQTVVPLLAHMDLCV